MKAFARALVLPLLIMVFSGSSRAATDQEGTSLYLSAGKIGIDRDFDEIERYGIEFRFRPLTRWRLQPTLGYIGTENDGSFSYLGLARDFWFAGRWSLTPSLAAGLYEASDDLKLGNDLEFRSGLELGYTFARGWRLAAGVFHLSNASLGDENPGTEELTLSLTIPLTGLWPR